MPFVFHQDFHNCPPFPILTGGMFGNHWHVIFFSMFVVLTIVNDNVMWIKGKKGVGKGLARSECGLDGRLQVSRLTCVVFFLLSLFCFWAFHSWCNGILDTGFSLRSITRGVSLKIFCKIRHSIWVSNHIPVKNLGCSNVWVMPVITSCPFEHWI